jgi:hypothetical protein
MLKHFLCVSMIGMVLPATAQVVLNIRVLDGHTGKPVVNVGVFAVVRPGPHFPSKEPVTDAHGLITVSATPGAQVQAIVNQYPTCRVIAKRDRVYGPILDSVDEIEQTGVVQRNHCSKHTAQPTPGELTLFVRPLHWWERLSD